uniref:Pco080381 n=1 Tax=Arundo donax TaxID=35708 RepID=A0A0A9EWL4_ARUDO
MRIMKVCWHLGQFNNPLLNTFTYRGKIYGRGEPVVLRNRKLCAGHLNISIL